MSTQSCNPVNGDLPIARTKNSFARRVDGPGKVDLEDMQAAGPRTTSGLSGLISSNIDERIAMVLKLMISSPMRSIPVESVAALLGLSPSRLRHLFKEQVGVAFHKYEVMLRLERVRLLLRTTDCRVKEAARMLGFVDMSNFTYMFKRAYGMTPGAIRSSKA